MPKRKYQPRQTSWKAEDFFNFEKGTTWYTIFVIVMIIIFGITLWVHNWLLAGVIAAATFAIVTFAKDSPSERRYRIDSSGVQVGNRKYKYDELKSFWIADTPEGALLYLQSTKRFSQPIMVNTGSNDEKRVRAILSKYLPEEQRAEILSDRINRWLRF